LDQMRAQGLKPPSSVYCALAHAYAKQGMCEQAMNVFRRMEEEGYEPNLMMFNLLINAFSVAGRHLEAFSVFDYMQEVVRP
jgi:pentatricopeptide repeat protein